MEAFAQPGEESWNSDDVSLMNVVRGSTDICATELSNAMVIAGGLDQYRPAQRAIARLQAKATLSAFTSRLAAQGVLLYDTDVLLETEDMQHGVDAINLSIAALKDTFECWDNTVSNSEVDRHVHLVSIGSPSVVVDQGPLLQCSVGC